MTHLTPSILHLFLGLALFLGMGAEEAGRIRQSCFFSGRVQKVGFRATTRQMALDFALTGWVKNLDDGRVQWVAEGPPEALEKFLDAVRKRFESNISKVEMEKGVATGEFHDFEIRDKGQ